MIRVDYEAFLLTETDRLSGMLPFLCQMERLFENVEPHLSTLVPHLSNVVPLFARLVPHLSRLVPLSEKQVITVSESINKTINVLKNRRAIGKTLLTTRFCI